MLGRLLTILIAFIWACFAAGLAKALFATTPAELTSLPADIASERMSRVFENGVFAAAQSLIFSAPFALVAVAIGEWQRIQNWLYYAMISVGIALMGFLSHWSSEVPGQATIVNNYALSAFLTAGFVAGIVYWLVAGRSAGATQPRKALPARPSNGGGMSAGAGKAGA